MIGVIAVAEKLQNVKNHKNLRLHYDAPHATFGVPSLHAANAALCACMKALLQKLLEVAVVTILLLLVPLELLAQEEETWPPSSWGLAFLSGFAGAAENADGRAANGGSRS